MGNSFGNIKNTKTVRKPSLGEFYTVTEDSIFTQDYLQEINRRNEQMKREAQRTAYTSLTALHYARLNNVNKFS
jgi:hypothetical protein